MKASRRAAAATIALCSSPMSARRFASAMILAAAAFTRGAAADVPPATRDPLTFAGGFRGAAEPGIIDVDSVWRTVRIYEAYIPGEHGWRWWIAAAARAAAIGLVDAPIGEVVGTTMHEVFGHGARARELGLEASSTLVVPRPYAWLLPRPSPKASTSIPELARASPAARAAIHAGGIEANYAHARLVARRSFESGVWQGRGDPILYISERLVYAPSFLLGAPRSGVLREASDAAIANVTDDVSDYAGALDELAKRRGLRGYDARARLQIAYVWNLFDPMMLSAVLALRDNRLTGDPSPRAWAPEIGGVTVLPRTTFALAPYGPEHGLGVWLRRRGVSAEISGATSSFLGTHATRAHVRVSRRARGFEVAAWGEAWSQPPVVLGREAEGDPELGGTVGASAAWDLRPPFGVAASLGAKTRGYAEALPLGPGLYGWAGVRLALFDAIAP